MQHHIIIKISNRDLNPPHLLPTSPYYPYAFSFLCTARFMNARLIMSFMKLVNIHHIMSIYPNIVLFETENPLAYGYWVVCMTV